MVLKFIIDKLSTSSNLSEEELVFLLKNIDRESREYLFSKAFQTRMENYGNTVFLRGLIEISNFCKRDCFYCGIRKSNTNASRYRLTPNEILECCKKGYNLGFRTFVLQGGEDPYFTDEVLVDVISKIKKDYPQAAVTLSLGERSKESYQALYDAGADRYLLRHETASEELYNSLHPHMDFQERVQCLNDLKEVGFQAGAGFLIGLPGLNIEDYAKDLLFLKNLNPHMVGLGPFIPQKDTPLKDLPVGDVETTLLMLAIVRLLIPEVLLPATTALGTIDPKGREKGFRVGANVIMPNLSPFENRAKYALYDGKKFVKDEAAEELNKIKNQIISAGFDPVMERGDNILWKRK